MPLLKSNSSSLLFSSKLSLIDLTDLIIGCTRLSLANLAIVSVGYTIITGDCVWSNAYPIMLSSASVLPICAPKHSTICSIRGSVNLSIGSFRYGVRFVLHLPGSADIFVNTLKLSAHSDKVYRSGGLNASSSSWNQLTLGSVFTGFDFRRVLAFARVTFEVVFGNFAHHPFHRRSFFWISELTPYSFTKFDE